VADDNSGGFVDLRHAGQSRFRGIGHCMTRLCRAKKQTRTIHMQVTEGNPYYSCLLKSICTPASAAKLTPVSPAANSDISRSRQGHRQRNSKNLVFPTESSYQFVVRHRLSPQKVLFLRLLELEVRLQRIEEFYLSECSPPPIPAFQVVKTAGNSF
jgi:hypothetical protein